MNSFNRHKAAYLVFAGLISGFFLFLLYPEYKIISEKEEEIQSLLQKIEKQELFFPLSETLGRELERLERIEFPEQIPPLSERECDPHQVIGEIRTLIQDHPFETTRIHSNVDTIPGDQEKLTLHVELEGQFRDFQELIFQIAQLFCAKSIEHVGVQPSCPNPIFNLRVWIMQNL